MELLASLLPLVVIFGVFWFMFIRPQKKRQQEYQDMLSNLERGDKVYTRGGLRGLITNVKEDELEVRIAPEVNVKLRRNGIADVIEKANKPEAQEENEDAEEEEVVEEAE